jgi:drug/metabolite transporter (DMT)-like permease
VVLWRLAFRETVGVAAMAGTALGLIGVGVLVWPTSGGATTKASTIGIILLVVVALSYATGSFFSPRLALPTDVFAVSAIQMLLAGAVLTTAGLAVGEGRQVDLSAVTPASWWALAYLIGPGSLLAYTAYVWLLAHVPVAQVATYAYVNPVVAVALGWLILSEPVSTRMLTGAAVTVAAVAVVVTSTRQPH